jgi:hypothetical protein
LVSATDFSTVTLALANDAVKNATAGDFVKISGDVYIIIYRHLLVQSMVILEKMPFRCRL